jgi:hypothetical protein
MFSAMKNVAPVNLRGGRRMLGDVMPHSSISYHYEHGLHTVSRVASVTHEGAVHCGIVFHGVSNVLQVIICDHRAAVMHWNFGGWVQCG